jgi:hypothetical protein
VSSFDVETWAAWARLSSFPKAKQPGDILVLGDMESTVVLAARAGNFLVETTNHGGRRTLIGSFSARDDAERTTIYWVGSGKTSRDPAATATLDGATLEESPIGVHLSWPGGSAEFGPGITGKLWARRFNWTRTRSLQQVADAF